MIRRIIQIDEERCNGCGICAEACHEGAIGLVDGKAKLLRDDYCDGLGDCLPACPTGAISFVEREAAAYDQQAVLENQKARLQAAGQPLACGCPGTQAREIARREDSPVSVETAESQLRQWPVQIQLAPVEAPYFDGAKLLVAADCAAYAYGDFHNRFMRRHVTLIGCPKLDAVDYTEKLTAIIRRNAIQSVTVVRMEVPCCGGIENAVRNALQASGKYIPWQVVTLSTDGRVIE